jgi:tRNA modification GTPase
MLKEQIESALKDALKAGDELKLSVLRMLLAAVHNREIEKRTRSGSAMAEALDEEETNEVMRQESKKRGDAAEAYERAGRTEAAARFSVKRLAGSLSARFCAIREDLMAAAAHLTAAIDFSEDVGAEVPRSVTQRLTCAEEALSSLAETYETGRLLTAGCRIAILGRPNAGKSTLFNALLGSARAIVTEVPGTTRDTLDATVDVRGIPVEIVDTAGLRETQDAVEKIGVERARREAERADAILYVFDLSEGFGEEDRAAVASFNGTPVMLVANKIDRVGPGQAAAEASFSAATLLCGLSPDAGEQLHTLLSETVGSRVATEVTSEVLGSLRQRDLVLRCRDAAAEAIAALKEGISPEYAATHVDAALDALADLFGETSAEDVLQRIFSSFCIGK